MLMLGIKRYKKSMRRIQSKLIIKEHCGCDKGHPEAKPISIIDTIKKIVRKVRKEEKYK